MSLLHRDLPQPPPCPPLSLPKEFPAPTTRRWGDYRLRLSGAAGCGALGPLAAAPRTPLVGGRQYKREFTRMTGLMNKYGSSGDRISPNRLKSDFISGLIKKQFKDYINIWIAENKDCTLFAMLEKAAVICQGIYPVHTRSKRRAYEMPSAPRNPPTVNDSFRCMVLDVATRFLILVSCG